MRRVDSQLAWVVLPLLFACFVIAIIVVAAPQAGNLLGGSGTGPSPRPNPTPSPTIQPIVIADSSGSIPFRSIALGFDLAYPAGWRRQEQSLQVIFSPSSRGLDPANLNDSAIWFGIPPDDKTDPIPILQDILSDFPPDLTIVNQTTANIAAETWSSVQIRFESPGLGGEGIATLAATSKNEVGYYVVAVAPAAQWNSMQPAFDRILQSFRFTEEAVLRPTDATPPPTPTPTPTPQIYIVQSGDTLSHISVRFDVEIEAIMNRNGLEPSDIIRTGQKLIIPTKRR